jgi:hypothetical protein
MDPMNQSVSLDTKSANSAGRIPAEFEKELNVYDANLIELLVNEGKYVVIRGEEIGGVFDTYDEALEHGYDKFGLSKFLVKLISRAEPIYYFSREMPACRP